MTRAAMILPGATLGMLGGGQLGRMFTVAARTLGYHVSVLDPDPDSPAGSIASNHVHAGYQDQAALDTLARSCAAITTEFENVPADSLRALADRTLVRPAADAVAILQDRIHEKTFLRDNGFATARFGVVKSTADLDAALAIAGTPALLKVSRFGYDGKGQARIDKPADAAAAFTAMDEEACVVEQLLPLKAEVSVVLARGADGAIATFPVAENQHVNGILDITIVPARVPAGVAQQAVKMAHDIAEKLDYVGVMAVEMFLLDGDRLAINEIAPRPHNSGHFTLDACVTSQFEQQVRALCGLPLGDTRLLSPVVMVNLLGDLWANGEPPWAEVFTQPNIKLHLYGKQRARPGRKMGHINCLDADVGNALALAARVKQALDDAAAPTGKMAEKG